MVRKKTRYSLGIVTIFLAAIVAILVHALLPSPGAELNAAEFDGRLVELLGFPVVASIYFVLLYLHIFLIYVTLGKRFERGKLRVGVRFGIAFGCMYLFGMQEVMVEGSPLTEYGMDFILYQFFMGLGDAIPVLVLCVVLAILLLNGRKTDEIEHDSKVLDRRIMMFMFFFFVERMFGYCTGLVDSDIKSYTIPVIVWTIVMGMVFGVMDALLSPVFTHCCRKEQILQKNVWTIGANWIWFNCFIGLILKDMFVRMLLRSVMDILAMVLACMFIDWLERGKVRKRICNILLLTFTVILIAFISLLWMIHGKVFARCEYKNEDTKYYLLYEEIDASKYPREQYFIWNDGKQVAVYEYGLQNDKGLIVVAPGHRDSNDVKLYEIRYFVDAGYRVLCLDYTGCYNSSGKSMNGYTQCVHDLDALLTYVDTNEDYQGMPHYLFGHSMGGYAVSTVLQYEHDVDRVVAASAFDSPREQWQYSVKRFAKGAYPIIRPLNELFIWMKYGREMELRAVDGINAVSIPVLVISAQNDVFYGGKSPIYVKKEEISNPNCSFLLMNKENHNGHYDYFLTDEALKYRDSKPEIIDKELYFEHDPEVMQMIIDYFEADGTSM